MRLTIFTTPLLSPLLKRFSRWVLRWAGWTLSGEMPSNTPKSVIIAAPHTSNWDLPYTLLVAFALELNIHWMGKIQIFRFPFNGIMRWLGGIAVDRSKSNNMVSASADVLRQALGELHLVIPPEGTRSQSRQWKTGFYYIALEAQVPLCWDF
jgi:1-acyl-sn-glycerol-3-phosphate acyltransferase